MDTSGDEKRATRRAFERFRLLTNVPLADLFNRKRTNYPIAKLSDRERELLELVAEGRSNKAIAQRPFIAERTVEVHVTQISSSSTSTPHPSPTGASSPCSATSAAHLHRTELHRPRISRSESDEPLPAPRVRCSPPASIDASGERR